MAKLTVEKSTELAYRQVRYSRAFTDPVGFVNFKHFSEAPSLRDVENRRNKKWGNSNG